MTRTFFSARHRSLALLLSLTSSIAPAATAQEPAPPKPPASERVQRLLKALTLEEAVDLLSGTGSATHAIERLHIPAFLMSDGPLGVKSAGAATAYAAGIALAATWDVDLAGSVGTALGRDARARGVQFLLGPGANVYRSPLNARNFEYLGEDPFLGGRIVVSYIQGVQSQHVSATVKHFLGNNSEYARRSSDSGIDERALRELYLPIFEAAVKEAHVGAVMCSYNLTNGVHMCEHPVFDSQVLKQQWGFSGVLMSDWDATHDGVASANAGLDIEMPRGVFMNRATLLPAVKDGRVTRAVIDDKVQRLLGLAERSGWLDDTAPDLSIARYSQTGASQARQGALESMVLLKNAGGLLPLDPASLKNVAVIGPLAYPGAPTGGGSARVTSFNSVSFLRGLSEALGTRANVTYASGVPNLAALGLRTAFLTAPKDGKPGLQVEEFADAQLSGAPLATRVEFTLAKAGPGGGGNDASFAQSLEQLPPERRQAFFASFNAPKHYERWTGYFTPAKAGKHTLFVHDRAPFRLLVDGQVVIDATHLSRGVLQQVELSLPSRPHQLVFEERGDPDFGRAAFRVGLLREDSVVDPLALKLAAGADAVVVAVGFDADTEQEASDRSYELPPGQAQLIREVCSTNPKCVVVLTSGGSVATRSWLERARGLIAAWYPGQEGGHALAALLLGKENPSGRLPISWERRLEDNPSHANYYYNDPAHPARIVYREGVFAGYRGYAQQHKQPLFPFGFGLSYTSFQTSKPSVVAAPADAPRLPSGRKPLYWVSFDVSNTGKLAGAEVAQLYIAPPPSRVPRPPRELRGFARVNLAAGQTQHVQLPLDARAFAYFDVQKQRWQVDAGKYLVQLGRSAEDIVSSTEVAVSETSVRLDE